MLWEDSNILLGMTRRSLRPLHFCLVVIVIVVAFSIWLYNNNSLPEHTLYLVICAEIRTRRFRHSKTYTRRRNVSTNKITHPSPMALHSMTSYIIQEKRSDFFREKVPKNIFPLFKKKKKHFSPKFFSMTLEPSYLLPPLFF